MLFQDLDAGPEDTAGTGGGGGGVTFPQGLWQGWCWRHSMWGPVGPGDEGSLVAPTCPIWGQGVPSEGHTWWWHKTKVFDCAEHNKLKNSERDGNTRPPYLSPEKPVCSQETTVRTRHGTMDWFKIGKRVCQGCILSPCLFKLYRVHHVKYQAGWTTSWKQDCWEKYQ